MSESDEGRVKDAIWSGAALSWPFNVVCLAAILLPIVGGLLVVGGFVVGWKYSSGASAIIGASSGLSLLLLAAGFQAIIKLHDRSQRLEQELKKNP